MEKLLKAYQHFRSGVYLMESLPLLGVNFLINKSGGRYQPSRQDMDYLKNSVDKLFQNDVENIEQGVYPISVLSPKNPIEHFSTLGKVYVDAVGVIYRRLFKKTKSFSKEAQKLTDGLPEYYTRNFHFQTDGYLSENSAEIYDHQVEILFKGTSSAMRRLFLKDMKDYFLERSNKKIKILEVAVGTGSATEYLVKTFPMAKITCLDLSPSYLKLAQKNLKKFHHIDYVQGKAEDLPFKDETFDAVISVYLYHEIPKEIREKVIAESLRVLKPSGYFGITDSIQMDDDKNLNWAIKDFPKDYHEPFYKNYIETPMENLVGTKATLIKKRIAFLTKSLSYTKE